MYYVKTLEITEMVFGIVNALLGISYLHRVVSGFTIIQERYFLYQLHEKLINKATQCQHTWLQLN